MAKENTDKKLYNLAGTLADNVEVKKNSNGKEYALAHVKAADGKQTTVLTYVKAGIEALSGKKAGAAVKLYGTFEKGDKGQTFSAMGESKPKEKSPEGPAL